MAQIDLWEKFPEKVDKARELILIGSYDDSVVYYQQAISILQLSMDSIPLHERPEFLKSLKSLQEEMQMVYDLKKEIDVWKSPAAPGSVTRQIPSSVSRQVHNTSSSPTPFANAHSHHINNNHHASNSNSNVSSSISKEKDVKWQIFGPEDRKYDDDVRQQSEHSPPKDPDVWSLPSPIAAPNPRRKPLVDSKNAPPTWASNENSYSGDSRANAISRNSSKNTSSVRSAVAASRSKAPINSNNRRNEPSKSSPPKQRGKQGNSSSNNPSTNAKKNSKDDDKKSGSTASGPQGKTKYSEMARDEGWVDIDLIESIERDIVDNSAPISFEDIAGLEEPKRVLQEAVMLPLLAPHLFTGRIKASKGVLMFGPPGTGKTLLAKAVAHECGTTFFNVSASTLSSKFRGDSEKMVRILFDMARYYAPATIFMDEIDAIAGSRGAAQEHEASRRVKTELLVQINGVASGTEEESRVMLLAATNLPWDLDEAMRRRLDKRVYIPLPDERGRRQLFQMNLEDSKKIKLAPDVDIEVLVKATEGYSGHDIHSVCTAAAMMPIRRIYTPEYLKELKNKNIEDDAEKQDPTLIVTQEDLNNALRDVCKSVGGAELDRYKQWEEEFGSK